MAGGEVPGAFGGGIEEQEGAVVSRELEKTVHEDGMAVDREQITVLGSGSRGNVSFEQRDVNAGVGDSRARREWDALRFDLLMLNDENHSIIDSLGEIVVGFGHSCRRCEGRTIEDLIAAVG